jgi:superfamily II DNA or RNA helicase
MTELKITDEEIHRNCSVASFNTPLSLDLRPYQVAVVERVSDEKAKGNRRILLVCPTGTGKTVIAGRIAKEVSDDGGGLLFLVHRRELVQQSSNKLRAIGVDHGIIQAGMPSRPQARVQIASIATLHARAVRREVMPLPPADLVIVDEAHHARSRTWETLLDAYPNAVIIGLTATPCRGDGRGLGNVFDVIVQCPPISELTASGYLVPARFYAPAIPDLKGVKTVRGDYAEGELAARMDGLTGGIVEHWLKLAERRRTVVFATSVGHSVSLRDEFRAVGVMAEHIDGGTPADERDDILRRLGSGEVEVVCNCMVLTEGWDRPEVSCAILARPTRQLGLFHQMVGRVLRPYPGKTDALVLDHSGAVFEHGFIDDPIEWSLNVDSRAVNVAQRSRSAGGLERLVTCPECKAVRMSGQPCSACGWRPRPRAKEVEVEDGDLHAVTRQGVKATQPTAAEKARFFTDLKYIASEHGYKSGWAAHKYKEKFGVWPVNRYALPTIPEPATRAWVQSRMIAYAKAREAERRRA